MHSIDAYFTGDLLMRKAFNCSASPYLMIHCETKIKQQEMKEHYVQGNWVPLTIIWNTYLKL